MGVKVCGYTRLHYKHRGCWITHFAILYLGSTTAISFSGFFQWWLCSKTPVYTLVCTSLHSVSEENPSSLYLQSSSVVCRTLQKPPDIWPPRTWHSLCLGQLRGPRQVLLPCAEYSGLVQECQGSAEREILDGLILESTGKSSFFREEQQALHLLLITSAL